MLVVLRYVFDKHARIGKLSFPLDATDECAVYFAVAFASDGNVRSRVVRVDRAAGLTRRGPARLSGGT